MLSPGNKDTFISAYEKAREFREKASEEYREGRLETARKFLARAEEKLAEARKFAKQAPDRAAGQTFLSLITVEEGDILAEYSLVSKVRNSFSNAVSYLDKAREKYLEILPPNHPKVLSVLLESARLLKESGRPAEAIRRYEQLLRMIRDYRVDDFIIRCEAFLGLSLALITEKRWNEAAASLELYTKELRRLDQDTEENTIKVARGLVMLGNVYSRLGNNTGALECYEAAVAEYDQAGELAVLAATDKTSGKRKRLVFPDTAEVALALLEAARMAKAEGNYSVFRKRLKRGEELIGALYRNRVLERATDEELVGIVPALLSLARIYRGLGAEEEARAIFSDALTAVRRSGNRLLEEEIKRVENEKVPVRRETVK